MRKMVVGDMEAVVLIHCTAFRNFFLTFIGPAFLRELYLNILMDESGIALVEEVGGGLLGFVVGSTQPAGLYRRLLRTAWYRFALAGLPAVVRRPRTAIRLVRALRAPDQATSAPGTGTLMSIAVLPEAQGAGVGRQLVMAFLAEARKRGLIAVDLTTDAIDNDRTNRFYLGLGFQLSRTFSTPEGRAMNEYRIDL